MEHSTPTIERPASPAECRTLCRPGPADADARSLYGEVNQPAPGGPLPDSTRRQQTGSVIDTDYVPLVESIAEGDTIAIPHRSGGSFDPMGVRSCDICRADDLLAIVNAHEGRWVFISLTLNRDLWTSPGAAYQRCNDRVREVTRAVSREGLHFTGFELQSKTGAGWPHWHMLVWCPDGRSLDTIREQARSAWHVTTESINRETGEVTTSREFIGWVDVEEARDRTAAATYMAKYITKQWEAVPSWMLNSRRQLRKYRLSNRCFDWLASAGRHERHRGRRMTTRPVRRRGPNRLQRERLAYSGAALTVLQKRDGKLAFVRTVGIPCNDAGASVLASIGASPLIEKTNGRTVWRVPIDTSRALRDAGHTPQSIGRIRHEYIDHQRHQVCSAWRRHQLLRATGEAHQADVSERSDASKATDPGERSEREPAGGTVATAAA